MTEFLAYSSLAASSPAGVIPTSWVQFLADVTLIDSHCTVNASFGIAFQYSQLHGLDWADIMPLGRLRSEFQSAFYHRLRTASKDELCGSMVG